MTKKMMSLFRSLKSLFLYTQTGIILYVPEEIEDELDRMAKCGGLKSRKDLFNFAIAAFAWAIKQTREGKIVGAYDEKLDRFIEVVTPALENAKPEEA
jgi:hypothetical protein